MKATKWILKVIAVSIGLSLVIYAFSQNIDPFYRGQVFLGGLILIFCSPI